jgi:hypothetical protein
LSGPKGLGTIGTEPAHTRAFCCLQSAATLSSFNGGFPQAKKLLGNAALDQLGEQMEMMKTEYKKDLSSNLAV